MRKGETPEEFQKRKREKLKRRNMRIRQGKQRPKYSGSTLNSIENTKSRNPWEYYTGK